MTLRRLLPKTFSDTIACMFLLAAIHGIGFFELLHVLPIIYSSPDHAATNGGFNLYYFHIIMGCYIYISVMINLYKMLSINTSIRGKVLSSILRPGGWHFCVVCEANAPPRSFHCHICNICILKRDHHCQFTGNCVGLYNQRYYLGMVLFMALAAGYSCMLNMDYFYHLFGNISFKTILTVSFPLVSWMFVQSDHMTGLETFMTSLCLVGFCLNLGLFVYHARNTVTGQSMHERSYNVHDYDLGWKENLGLVLGSNWKYALLCPLINSPVPSDGLEYITKSQYESLKTM